MHHLGWNSAEQIRRCPTNVLGSAWQHCKPVRALLAVGLAKLVRLLHAIRATLFDAERRPVPERLAHLWPPMDGDNGSKTGRELTKERNISRVQPWASALDRPNEVRATVAGLLLHLLTSYVMVSMLDSIVRAESGGRGLPRFRLRLRPTMTQPSCPLSLTASWPRPVDRTNWSWRTMAGPTTRSRSWKVGRPASLLRQHTDDLRFVEPAFLHVRLLR